MLTIILIILSITALIFSILSWYIIRLLYWKNKSLETIINNVLVILDESRTEILQVDGLKEYLTDPQFKRIYTVITRLQHEITSLITSEKEN